MKGTIFLVMFATSTLLACGKSEEPVVSPPALETPQQAEPAPVAAAPVPVEAVEPAPAPVDTPPAAQTAATPPAPAKLTQPAAAKSVPAPVGPAPKAPVASVTSTAPASTPKPDLAHGQQIYRQACAFCHDKGIAGAPKLGDAAAWAPRLGQGMDALYTSSLRGKGAMPAKGGNPSLADADVKAAVDFIAAQAR